MKNVLYLCFFLIVLSQVQLANARIYKWLDENGKTIYSEKPPADTSKVKVEEIKVPGVSEDVAKSAQEKYLEDSKNFNERLEKAAETEQKAAQDSKKKKEFADYCRKLRSRLASLQSKSKITQTGSDGKKKLLNKGTRAAEITQARNNINKHCK